MHQTRRSENESVFEESMATPSSRERIWRLQPLPILLRWLSKALQPIKGTKSCTKIGVHDRFWGDALSATTISSLGQPRILISTDLDGSLLGHEHYDMTGISVQIQALSQMSIPVVFNSSKTTRECLHLQEALSLDAPFIAENGAAIVFREDDDRFDFSKHSSERLVGGKRVISLGIEISHLLAFKYAYCPEAIDIVSGDSGELTRMTGLDEISLEDARDRQYSLPMVLDSAQYASLETKAFDFGYRFEVGGRFKTLQGKHDKAGALELVAAAFKRAANGSVKLIGLGDAPNDQRMLEACDVAVVVRREGCHHLMPQAEKVVKTESEAPSGWISGVEAALATLNRVGPLVDAPTLHEKFQTLRARGTWSVDEASSGEPTRSILDTKEHGR